MSSMSGASVKQRKQQAMTLLQAGHVAAAKELFEGLVRDARRDPDVWHLLAACHCMLGDDIKGEFFARKAVELMPSFSGAWVNLGSALLGQRKLVEAEAALREAIKHAPGDAQAHSNLGSVYSEMKKFDEAEKCYREALRLQPNFPDALTNLGLVMQNRGNLEEAVSLHRRALALSAQHVDAHYNLGYALLLRGEAKAAIPHLERVTQLRPEDTRGWSSLGGACARDRDQKRAVACYERSISLNPNNAVDVTSLGISYLGIDEKEKAIAMLTRALELNPNDSDARFWLAAAGHSKAPDKMTSDTVTKLFDEFAGNFDQHLVGKLQYRTPALLSTALRRTLGKGAKDLSLLDLGCGTGLVGVEVKDIAGYLAGVDLSPKMIDQARARGVYHELLVQDIVTCMEEASRKYDAVLSADVFVYLGVLDNVFAATHRCLCENGLFIFSVEAHIGDEPFYLRTSGRYAHSLPYLRELSARHNFTELGTETVTLRTENNIPMEGYMMVLRRS